jgi:multicomponent Na+:H+ antiporter subunit D
LVAYSTVSQIGYLFLVFALARAEASDGFQTWCGGVLFAISHACAKGSLFLAAGTVLHVAGHDRIRDLPAVARHMPITFFSMGLAAVALMGLPPTAAFIGKWMMIKAAFTSGHPELALIIVIGGLLAAGYLFRVLATVFTDPHETNHLQTMSRVHATAPLLRPAPRILEQTTLGLAVISLLLGLATAPIIELLSVNATWAEWNLVELGR